MRVSADIPDVLYQQLESFAQREQIPNVCIKLLRTLKFIRLFVYVLIYLKAAKSPKSGGL